MNSSHETRSFSQDNGIVLGRTLPSPFADAPPQVVCDSSAVQRHADRPWFQAYLAQQLGLPPAPAETLPEEASVPDSALAGHTLITGGSGAGKTRLAERIAGQQIQNGQSFVALDPKIETLAHLCAQAKAAGLAPEQVTVLSPRMPSLPGWNPFCAPLPAAQSVADFVAVLERSTTGWGPRLQDLVTNAALLISGHRLSLYELVEALRREDFLRALLLRAPRRDSLGFQEAHRFFSHEFLAWSPSIRTEALGPLFNKVRELLRNECLSAVLCATENTLDLSTLWQRQSVVLIHLDRATLGEEGTRLLAGLMATSLLRTAQRTSGPVPVTLMLDEAATAETFMGETLAEMVAVAREHRLHVLACCQNVSQLGERLRTTLNTNTAVKVSFRMAAEDARVVAQSLAAGTPPRLLRVRADEGPRDRRTGQAERTLWRHHLLNAQGRRLQVSQSLWERLRWRGLFDLTGQSADIDPLEALMRQVGRLYVQAADTGRPVELRRYIRGLKAGEWWLDGPAPLSLTVAFPRPRLSGAERLGEREAIRLWAHTLESLPTQTAVLRVGGGQPILLRVADMPDAAPSAALKGYLASSLRATALTALQVHRMRQTRVTMVEHMAASVLPVPRSGRSRGALREPLRPHALILQSGPGSAQHGSGGMHPGRTPLLSASPGEAARQEAKASASSAPARSSIPFWEEETGADGSLV